MADGAPDKLHGVSVDGVDMGTGTGGTGAASCTGGTGIAAGAASAEFPPAWRDFRYSEYDVGCSEHFRAAVRRQEEPLEFALVRLLNESLNAGRRWIREAKDGEMCLV